MHCTLSVVFIYLWLTCSLFSKINIKDMKGILQINYEHLWEISAYIFNESNVYTKYYFQSWCTVLLYLLAKNSQHIKTYCR